MDSGVKVLDVMTLRPITTSPSTCLRDVAALMYKHNIGSVLVKDATGVCGIVTKTDFVHRAILEGHDPKTTPVSKIMSDVMVSVSPGMDVFDALLMMKDSNVHHIPVVDGPKLVGYVTKNDILKVQPHLFENIADMLALREEDRKPLGRYQQAEIDED